VIANPPFSLERWGKDQWINDPFGRNMFGVPPRKSGDYAWVEHMVASMALGSGRMAVVLPQGALFRKGVEGKIRKALLQADLVEAVIGLAPTLFYGTGLAGSIMILRRSKPAERQHRVLIVDASTVFRKGRGQNFLDPEHAQQIVSWYRAFEDVPERAKVATLDEIKAEDWTLNIPRYVPPPMDTDIPPLEDAVAAFKEALGEARAAENRLRDVLTAGEWFA